MADFGAPVAQGVAPPNPAQGLSTLSSILSLKQQQLGIAKQEIGLQQQQQELSAQTSAATVASINASQQQALSQVNWKQFVNPDGSYNLTDASKVALQVAPNLGPDFVTRLAAMSQGGAQTKEAYHSLGQQLQAQVRSAFGTFAADPHAKLSDLAATLKGISQNEPNATQGELDQIINHSMSILTSPDLITGQPKTPQQQKEAALAFARSGLTPSEASGPQGLATPIPGTVSNGTQILPTKTSRITGNTTQAGAPVANLHTQISLPNGQIAVLNAATGQYELVGGGKGGSGNGKAGAAAPAITAENDPARPAPNAPAQLQAQWQKSIADTNALVQSTRHADQEYGNNIAIAQDIRALTRGPGGENIGPGTPELTRIAGAITSRFGGSQGVTNVQTLESFLDRQAASMTSAMGLPATNLGNEQARTISGNIGMQVGALRAKNDYNEALAQGLHDFRSGLDKVAGFGGNASPTAVNQFRSEWAKYFNPMAVEYNLAKSRGDREVMDAIAKNVTPGQAKRMLADLDAMQSLAKTGKLP